MINAIIMLLITKGVTMELIIGFVVAAVLGGAVIVVSAGTVGFAGAFFSGMSKFLNSKIKQLTTA